MRIPPKKKAKASYFYPLLPLALGFTTPLSSQAATPTTITPAQVQGLIQTQPTLTGRLLPSPIVRATTASVSVPGFTPQAATLAATRTTFVLRQLNVTGNTVYGSAQLENMFHNYIGRTISLADLQKMADDITLKYRNDGYILTRAIVPAQNIENGVITIRIVEGYINQVNIVGDPKGARKILEGYGEQLKRARPLNIKDLERYALLANDIPGMSVHVVLGPAQIPQDELAPSEITPGAAVLTFVASQSMAHGYFTFDNRGTKYLGPNEFLFGANINSIFRPGDTTGFQAVTTADNRDLEFIKLYHQTPLGNNGMMLNFAASYTHSTPQYILSPLDIVSTSTYYATGITYPVIRTRQQSLFVNLGIDATDSKTTSFGTQLYDDKLRSLRAGLNYDLTDRWLGINQLGGQISQGLPGLGASANNSEDISRPNGRTDYTKANFNASRLQSLGYNFSLYGATQGQYGFVPLLSAEQFTFGGADYGQAYDPAELTGDSGIAAKAELRYDIFTTWHAVQSVEPYAFYDIGKVWNNQSTGLPYQSASAASAGVGVRSNVTSYLSGSLVWAKPLTRNVATEGNKDPRVFFSITLAGDTPSSTPALPLPPRPPQLIPTGTGLKVTAPMQQQVVQAAPQPIAPVTATSTVAPAPAAIPTPKTVTPAPTTSAAPKTMTNSQTQPFTGLTEISNTQVSQTSTPVAAKTTATGATTPVVAATTATKTQSTTSSENYYVLQLMSGRDLAGLKQFAAEHNITDQVNFIHTQRNGGDWYILAYGHYDSSRAAEIAATKLPAALRQLHPWVRGM